MNDDYLWDGSGEEDKEVAKLEELFRELRFNPVAATPPSFRLPAPAPRKQFSLLLRIAAGLVFLLVAGGAALKLSRPSLLTNPSGTFGIVSTKEDKPHSGALIEAPEASQTPVPRSAETAAVGPGVSVTRANPPLQRIRNRSYARYARVLEGERAKDELMAAFRIASRKLNEVRQILSVNKETRPSS